MLMERGRRCVFCSAGPVLGNAAQLQQAADAEVHILKDIKDVSPLLLRELGISAHRQSPLPPVSKCSHTSDPDGCQRLIKYK